MIPKLIFAIFLLTAYALAQNCTAPAGGWSISNQPPAGCHPYLLWKVQLPGAGNGGPLLHLAPNSDAIAQNTLGYSASFYGVGTLQLAASGNDGSSANPFYYGRATDPIYKMGTTCQNPGSIPANNPTNTFWHIPNQAAYAGGQSDMFFTVWDQTTNMTLSTYTSHHLTGLKLQPCSATTNATACSMFEMHYCNMANYTTDKGYAAGNGAGDTLGDAPAGLYIRATEWMAGNINHALYLNTNCEASTKVFPAVGHAFTCPDGNTGHPPHGSLYFLDYTDAQISGMAIKPWQKAIIWTMAHYGGYVGDTDGSTNLQIVPNRYEAGEAYLQAGIVNPLPAWLASQGIPSHIDGTSTVYSVPMWAGIPNLVGPNCPSTPCGISKHAHIADPCVALAMAGQSGGCGTGPPPPSTLPTSCKPDEVRHRKP